MCHCYVGNLFGLGGINGQKCLERNVSKLQHSTITKVHIAKTIGLLYFFQVIVIRVLQELVSNLSLEQACITSLNLINF